MGMSLVAIPDWIPTELVSQATVDRTARRVNLKVLRGTSTQLTFGQVPDGWAIALDASQLGHPTTITAAQVGRKVQWTLRGSSQQPITLDGQFRVIRLRPGGGLGLHVILTNDLARITTSQPSKRTGRVTVDGQNHSYVLELEGGRASVNIDGEARIKRLTGHGPTDIDSPFAANAAIKDFVGHIRCGDLISVSVTSPEATLQAATVAGSHLTVKSARVTAVERDSMVYVTDTFRADASASKSTITCSRASEGVGIVVGTFTDNTPLPLGLDLDSPAPAQATTRSPGGDVSGSRLICKGPADIVVGDAQESVMKTEGSVVVHGEIARPDESGERLHIEAGCDIHLRGAVTLGRNDRIRAGADLLAENPVSGHGAIGARTMLLRSTVESITVNASALRTLDTLTGVLVTAAARLTVDGDVNPMTNIDDEWDRWSRFTLGGAGVFEGDIAAAVSWEPAAACTLTCSKAAPILLRVSNPQEHPAELALGPEVASIPALEVTGELILNVETTRGQDAERVDITTLDLVRGALELRVARPVVIDAIEAATDSRIVVTRESKVVQLTTDNLIGLSVVGESAVELVDRSESAVELADRWDTLARLSITGPGPFTVQSSIGRLNCHSDDGVPELLVDATGQILELTGDVRLGEIGGVVRGGRTRRKGRTRFWPWAAGNFASRAPRVIDIAEQKLQGTGQVASVDPTSCPYNRLPHAQTLHVFEPDPQALIEYTRPLRFPWEAQTAAYTAQRIAEQVSRTAASGSARSAAAWAAARTHHAALPRLSIERAMRFIHRWLGYSQRPVQPLITFVIAVFAWTLAVWFRDRPSNMEGPRAFFSQGLDIALIPTSWILRLQPTDESPMLLFENATIHVVAFLTTAIPLVFFVIALRNFMRPPTDG